MKTYLQCIPCFARQAVEAAEMATEDPALREQIVRSALREAADIAFDRSPPYMGMRLHRIVRRAVGNIDPYKKLKDLYNQRALELYPRMKELVRGIMETPDRNAAPDSREGLRAKPANRLEAAARVAIAGNIIDFGITVTNEPIALEEVLRQTLQQSPAIDDIALLAEAVGRAERILYLADNAGEIVFDRVLIEEIPAFSERVTVAVRGEAVINDATLEDARAVGLDEVVRVIDNGNDAPGTILDQCSAAFRQEYHRADLVISKGQGNYETLSEQGPKVFFLLKAKCPVIARDLGVAVGDIVVKRG